LKALTLTQSSPIFKEALCVFWNLSGVSSFVIFSASTTPEAIYISESSIGLTVLIMDILYISSL
jgi:hypothetical protein